MFTPPASPGGTTDKVTIADASSIDLPGSFTIEAWVEPTTVDAEGTILEKRQSYALAIRNGGLLQYQLDSVLSGTRGIWFDTGLTIQPGRWTHVALVKDGTDVRVYLNGTLEYSRSAQALDEFGVLYAIPPTISVTANDLVLGSDLFEYAPLDGRLSDVRIWSAARSTTLIDVTYDLRFASDIGTWLLDETSGSVARIPTLTGN
ncbi:MAG: LamG domain-containing protein, partial [Actinomycetota bacterium]